MEEVLERFRTNEFHDDFDMIVAIANGGIVPAGIINQRLQKEVHLLRINLRDEYQHPKYDAPQLLAPVDFDFKDKSILLVDDRIKTGSTIRLACELLKEARMIKTFAVNGTADYALFDETCFKFPWIILAINNSKGLMDRRDFLKTLAVTGAVMTVQRSEAMDILAQKLTNAGGGKVDLVAVMGGEPEAMFRRAITEMGGMKQFIKPGQKVVVKPNIGWDKVPELAGNTNPKLVAEIVKQCLAAGAKEVTVFDHTCDDWQKCYKNSGIEEAAKAAGAKVMPAHLESYYKPVSLPKGVRMKSAKVHEAILNSDVWINVPILKNHGGANLTISMKNHMGIVWDRGFFHSNDLQQCIADICTMDKKAVLNVVDAYRVLKTNGPRGRSASDVVLTKGLFISQDIVAVDTAATKFFNQVREMPLESVAHLANGQALKIGTMDLDKLNVKRIKL